MDIKARNSALERGSLPFILLFFLSGFPALIYQIVWQRALFTIYGVNVESVTIVVAVFMVGLGLGSLAGGALSVCKQLPLLGVFGAIEMSIGLCGLFSLQVFQRVGALTAGAPMFSVGLLAFGLLLVPTLLMGSTLPLLAEYFVSETGSVGESVGILYCVNTCGSAMACFVAGGFMMRALGQSDSVRAAAALNMFVGGSALVLQFFSRQRAPRRFNGEPSSEPGRRSGLAFSVALVFAALAGFVSLAYEIVWYRVYAFASGDRASAFAYLLGSYLAGIAIGSLAVHVLSRRVLTKQPQMAGDALSALFMWAGIASFLVAPAVAMRLHEAPYATTLPMVTLAAMLLGAVFPLLSHAAIDAGPSTGRQLSFVYLANIAGAASGSVLVGFVLMDVWPARTIAVFLLAVSTGSALLLLPRRKGTARSVAWLGAITAVFIASVSPWAYTDFYERLLLKGGYLRASPFQHLVETRSGVIAVGKDGSVYGGGEYDGHFNIDPVHDSNSIFRGYLAVALHPHPVDVLVIGLSSGSWVQVIANAPSVRHVTVVEINPGYLQLIPKYPIVASLVQNPRVDIVIDDGRRWLLGHPDRKFDLAVMNTRINWRAYASDVLSVEFLQLVRRHLNPGGIHIYNTTWSKEAIRSGLAVFPYGFRIANFLAVSESPMHLDRARTEALMSGYSIDGKAVLDLNTEESRKTLREMADLADVHSDLSTYKLYATEDNDSLRRSAGSGKLITDDNMGTEWEPF